MVVTMVRVLDKAQSVLRRTIDLVFYHRLPSSHRREARDRERYTAVPFFRATENSGENPS